MRYKKLNEEEKKIYNEKYCDYIQGNPLVGDIVYEDIRNYVREIFFSSQYIPDRTPIGVVFDVAEKMIKIVNLYEGENLAWCTKEAAGYDNFIETSETDGSGNWKIICNMVKDTNIPGKYPAFEYVNGLGKDWYLPAKDELNKIYENKTKINNALDLLSKTDKISANVLNDFKYWSSCQIGDEDNKGVAYYTNFSGTVSDDGYGKWREYHVRAVKFIKID